MPLPTTMKVDREDGFTLIELLIVVLILGILAAIAIPVYLGIQNQAHQGAVQADVNQTVKKVQVNLTEGGTVAALYNTTTGSDKGSTVQIKASTTTGAAANDFMVVGNESTTNTGGTINYTYTYDSVTGKFTADSGSGTLLGGGSGATTLAAYDLETDTPPANMATPTYLWTRTSTTSAHSGTYVYSTYLNTQGSVDLYLLKTTPGATYTFSAWVKSLDTNCNYGMSALGDSGAATDTITTRVTSCDGTWQKISLTSNRFARNSYGYIDVTLFDGKGGANRIMVDDLSIVQN